MDTLKDLLLDDLRDVARRSHETPFDAVVVGSGPSGSTTARTLAERGLNVVVLEAGPLVLLGHASATELRFIPGFQRTLQEHLSYSPGGSGSPFGNLIGAVGGRGVFWTGAAPRFLDDDFRGWPLASADLADSYAWAERAMFVSLAWGQTALAQTVARRLRINGLPAEPEAFAVASGASTDGALSGAIGNPISILLRGGGVDADPERRRLRLVANAFVSRFLLSSAPEVAVEVIDARDDARVEVLGRVVVVAAGGFESVRLAVTSGLPDRSGTIGTRLSDHLFARAYFPLPAAFYQPDRHEAGAVIVRPGDGRPFQLEIHLPARRFFGDGGGAPWDPAPTDEYSVMVRSFAPAPLEPACCVVTNGADGRGAYNVQLETTPAAEESRKRMRDGLVRVRDALGAHDADITDLDLGSSNHEAGGLIMSDEPSTGVVDPFGRSWADPRVCVFDASAWPSIGSTNPHLTLVAIARRQATLLAGALGSRP